MSGHPDTSAQPLDWAQFPEWGARAAQWAGEYHAGLRDHPVRPPLNPGATLAALPEAPPEQGESTEAIFKDFEDIIMPGMTHWQHPRFFAYFPSNACVLYTSPSPRDATLSRMPSSA